MYGFLRLAVHDPASTLRNSKWDMLATRHVLIVSAPDLEASQDYCH
jgi:hypothetical protein